MNILFLFQSPAWLRFYDETIRELARRGHVCTLACMGQNERKIERLEDAGLEGPGIVLRGQAPLATGPWAAFARAVRGTMDFLRYLHPRYRGARKLRERMRRKALPRLLWGLDRIPTLPVPLLDAALHLLRACEAAVPCPREARSFLADIAPDALVVCPLVDPVSPQVDYVKAARRLHIPTAAAIGSWDNLTNKGLLRVQTDRLFVWNEIQRDEAVSLHGYPGERVVVTGAQSFDRWFGRAPAMNRARLCAEAGLPPDRPILLFVASSAFIAGAEEEVALVRRWIASLRSHPDERLRSCSVLVRPYPYKYERWLQEDLSDLRPCAIWPRQPFNPFDEEERSRYFDSLFHSEAVVGINTSAMVEAAVLGRPVHTILSPEFQQSQEGTLHFHYLRADQGGCVRVAASLEESLDQIAESLRDPDAARTVARRFVSNFVRPHGLDSPCTPRLASAIEDLGRLGPL